MNPEMKELYSERILAGSRTYFLDVKETRDGTKHLVISETRLKESSYIHNRVFIF